MPDSHATLWNVLHDGTIESISASQSSENQCDLLLDVGVEYLRSRFPEPGEHFRIALSSCSRFAYREYGSEEWLEELSIISIVRPDILCAEDNKGICIVSGDQGAIEFQAEQQSLGVLSVDGSVREISLDELKRTAAEYWAQWAEQAESMDKLRTL